MSYLHLKTEVRISNHILEVDLGAAGVCEVEVDLDIPVYWAEFDMDDVVEAMSYGKLEFLLCNMTQDDSASAIVGTDDGVLTKAVDIACDTDLVDLLSYAIINRPTEFLSALKSVAQNYNKGGRTACKGNLGKEDILLMDNLVQSVESTVDDLDKAADERDPTDLLQLYNEDIEALLKSWK